MDIRVIGWDDETRMGAYLLAMCAAAILHVSIFWALSYTPLTPLPPIADRAIRIDIIQENIKATPKAEPIVPPIAIPVEAPPVDAALIEPTPIIEPAATPTPRIKPAPPNTIVTEPPRASVPVIIASPLSGDDEEDEETISAYAPSRWALEPILSEERLVGIFGQGFADDIDCLRSLSVDCKELRKSIFAEYQVTKDDPIEWEQFAHTGLDSRFYGQSEAEIRQTLAIPTAGQNGFTILPGIRIDGNFWDTLHGVNKKCPVLRGIRNCPENRPSADNKRYHIPKKKDP